MFQDIVRIVINIIKFLTIFHLSNDGAQTRFMWSVVLQFTCAKITDENFLTFVTRYLSDPLALMTLLWQVALWVTTEWLVIILS